MDLKLKGKVAIVTGAGRGIGRAIALALANEGSNVTVNDIDAVVAQQVSEKIISIGTRSLPAQADVTKRDQVERMVAQTLEEFGKVNILVNNAGIVYDADNPSSRKLFQESHPEDWNREIDLILHGTLNCTKSVIGHMIKQRSGRIVNIASDAGRANIGLKRVSTYAAAKGGVIALTKCIAMEVAEYGITVNSVSPGLTRTTRSLLAESQRATSPQQYEYYKNIENSLVKAIPLGRIGEPDDIAKSVVFFASDASSWITGQCLSVNGGQLMV